MCMCILFIYVCVYIDLFIYVVRKARCSSCVLGKALVCLLPLFVTQTGRTVKRKKPTGTYTAKPVQEWVGGQYTAARISSLFSGIRA